MPLTFLPTRLRSRMLLAFLGPSLLFFVLAGTAGYVVSRDVLEDDLGWGLSSLAAAAASQLSGERLLLIAPGDDVAQTRTYRNLLGPLEEVRSAAGLRRVFAVDTDKKVRLDAGGGLPVGVELPELLRDQTELTRVFAGQRAFSEVLFEGPDGQLYKTGYAPVFWEGRVVGAVGVEGSASFFRPLRRLYRALAIWGGVALCVLGVIALLTGRMLTLPLERLMRAALRIGRGDLVTAVPSEPLQEVGVLARELEEMRRALESRERQLNMMLAGIAHEVRNPLGGIALFAGLLSEDLPPEATEAKGHVQRILRELQYLQRLVDEFLAFARDAGLALQPVQPAKLLAHARELLFQDLSEKQLNVELVAEEGTVDADPALLTGALVNLMKNAIQASPVQGTLRLKGTCHSDRYVIQVADEGPGIPEALMQRIFEPFFSTREKGTGLGLPLARKLLRAHGGDLTVEPTPRGATFSLWLPLLASPRP